MGTSTRPDETNPIRVCRALDRGFGAHAEPESEVERDERLVGRGIVEEVLYRLRAHPEGLAASAPVHDSAAERREAGQALLERGAASHLEHHVGPATVGEFTDAFGPVRTRVVYGVIRAER